MEFEGKLGGDVWIGPLLKRKSYIEADSFPVCLRGPAIRRFHNARTAAGANDKSIGAVLQSVGPLRQHSCQHLRFTIIPAHRTILVDARRSEEHDSVADLLAPEVRKRL